MPTYEYQVDLLAREAIEQVVYFCNTDGDCRPERVGRDQLQNLVEMLNKRGGEGWELVQANFSANGALLLWKREHS